MSNKKILIILFLIVVLGAFLRFWKLGEQPFVTDEFLDMNASYGYYKTGQWLAWDFNLQEVSQDQYPLRDERSWMYRWQSAQLFKWFPATEAVARSVSVIWGLISIVVMYFVGKYYTRNKIAGLLAAFLFSVSISGIILDRMFRMYAMFFPVFLLFSWFIFRFLEEKYEGKVSTFLKIQNKFHINAIWFIPALIFGLLSLHLHPIAVNIGIIIIIYLAIQAALEYYRKRIIFSKYAIFIIMILVAGGAVIIVKPEIISYYLEFTDSSSGNLTYFLAPVSDYINPALVYALIIFGLFYTVKKNTETFKGMLWTAVCFFSVILAAVFFWKSTFGTRFIFFIESFGIILLASGIYALAVFLKENSLKYKKEIFAGTIAMFLLIIPNYAYFFGKENVYHRDPDDPDYRKAYQYFLKKRNAQDVLITKNFRSYYYRDAGTKVENIKSEKVNVSRLENIVSLNSAGWLISGDIKGDFEEEARAFIDNNVKLEREINGINIYRWGNPKEKN